MMSNNKILTVSYGTFSCTLEGFDDSFGTMKAIAEYFRDLASDDRYFGAEPPQPDVEMLARIAEREISRRVDARETDGRYVLSAEQSQAATAEQPAQSPVDEVAEAPAPAVPVQQLAPEAAVISDRIAGPVEQGVVDLESPEKAQDDEAPAVQGTPEVEAQTASEQEDEAPVYVDPEVIITDVAPSAPEAEEFFAMGDPNPAPTVEEEDEALAAPVEADEAPAPDSIAAKLQRIRAVVSQSQEVSQDGDAFDDEYSEDLGAGPNMAEAFANADVADMADEDAIEEDVVADSVEYDDPEIVETETEEVSEETETVVAEAEQDVEALSEEQDEQDISEMADVADDNAEDDNDDVSAILARFDDDAELNIADEVEVAELSDSEEGQSASADESEDDTLLLDTLAAFVAEDVIDDDEDQAPAANLFDDQSDAADDDDDELESIEIEDMDERDPEDATAPRARIVKVKRSEIDAAIASGALEEVTDADEASDDKEASETSLSDEQEAELLADLAEVEAEFAVQDATDVDAPLAEEAAAETEVDETVAEDETADAEFDDAEVAEDPAEDTAAVAVEDEDVSRLMAEAENQMEEPESTSRRSAFAHLKAAVMAKKADKGIGKEDEDKDGAYRLDLASVVKPRRPEARGSTERPEGPRPAPLKLVAEQRVDIDASSTGPVRPRRIAARDDAPVAEAGTNFEDYASEMGAHDLPDLLEAAASYLSFVEGREQFSRPQLMTKVRQVEKEDFSREDGLRSFGQLLRAGKIEKIKGGRFAVTGDIGYRPDHRAAG